MPKGKREGGLEEAFILLNQKTAEVTAEVVGAIEGIGGRPLYLYPPGTIIALIPKKKIEQLKSRNDILSVDLDEIEEERIRQASPEIGFVMAAWNQHLRQKRG